MNYRLRETICLIFIWTCQYSYSLTYMNSAVFCFRFCTEPLGMERRIILDDQLSSSSYLKPDRTPDHGRLNEAFAWCSSSDESKPLLYIDLRQTMSITGISLQGDSLTDSWVTKFLLRWSVIDRMNSKYVIGSLRGPKVSNLSPGASLHEH